MKTVLIIGVIAVCILAVMYFVVKSTIDDIGNFYFDNDDDYNDIY